MKLDDHPTVRRYYERKGAATASPEAVLETTWLRRVVRDAGADDVGIASIDSPVLADYRSSILTLLPETWTCVSVVCRMNPENVRSPYRQQYELEYHHMYAEADHVARRAVVALNSAGIRAMDVCSSYPMNMERWPDAGMWYVAHKKVAEAGGMGRMGLNHLVGHPRFGPFIALSSILIDREVTEYDQPIEYDPCVKCMLCVTSCPVGALNADGHFNSIACVTHSYRSKYGGFTDWAEQVVCSRTPVSYRRRFTDQETVLLWQALAVGTSYNCTNCMAVCPSGDDNIGLYVDDRDRYSETVAKKLQAKRENVYVVRGSDAEAHTRKRFPHKTLRFVGNGVRAPSAAAFLDNLHIMFQREASKGLDATYHLSFTGEEVLDGTVVIRNKKIHVERGHSGTPDVRIRADSRAWIRIVNKELNFVWAALSGKVRVRGPMKLMKAFVRCFPS